MSLIMWVWSSVHIVCVFTSRLGEVEGVLLSNAGVSNGNDAVGEDAVEAVDSIHPSVKTG